MGIMLELSFRYRKHKWAMINPRKISTTLSQAASIACPANPEVHRAGVLNAVRELYAG
jgi:hypothetical protein